MQKNLEKMDGQKIDFFRQFWRFLDLRRRFLTIFGPKTGSRRLLFRCFFENGDFVKIVLPLWWEHNFQGSDPPKIGSESDSERHRREKSTKIASGALSGRTFSLPGSFLVDFGLPAGTQNIAKTSPGKKELWIFGGRKLTFCFFFVRACSRRVPERFRRLRGLSQSRFRYDFATLFCRFRRDLFEDFRVLPGCRRDPHPTSVTHSAGFPWGTAISRSDLNSPYPNGVLAWF